MADTVVYLVVVNVAIYSFLAGLIVGRWTKERKDA